MLVRMYVAMRDSIFSPILSMIARSSRLVAHVSRLVFSASRANHRARDDLKSVYGHPSCVVDVMVHP